MILTHQHFQNLSDFNKILKEVSGLSGKFSVKGKKYYLSFENECLHQLASWLLQDTNIEELQKVSPEMKSELLNFYSEKQLEERTQRCAQRVTIIQQIVSG